MNAMNKTKEDLIFDAFTLAVAHIQEGLGVTDGGFAGMWFSDDNYDTVLKILSDYYDAEKEFNEREELEGRS